MRCFLTAFTVLLAHTSPAVAADPPDGIALSVAPGPAADDVTLTWVGGIGAYRIDRSTSAAAITDLPNFLGDTFLTVWVDSPPPPQARSSSTAL